MSATIRANDDDLRREANHQCPHGQKKWIGNATFARHHVIGRAERLNQGQWLRPWERDNPGFLGREESKPR